MVTKSVAVPKTMKAFCYSSFGRGHFRWMDAAAVPSVGRNDILVKVCGTTVNHMDYFSAQIPPVRLLRHHRPGGFDLSGTVVKVGAKEKKFKPGDRVFGLGQGFAEYASVKPWMIAHVPSTLPDLRVLGAYPSVSVTALQILNKYWLKRAFPDRVSHLVVIGASGGVGCSVVQLARALAPTPDLRITAVSSGKHESFCRSQGASDFVDYTRLSDHRLSRVITPGSVDLVIDAVSGNVGTPNYVDDAKSLLNHTGMYMSTNSLRLRDYAEKFITTLFGESPLNHSFELFMMNPFTAGSDLEEIAKLVAASKLKLPIQESVPFTELNMRQALSKIEQRHMTGKINIVVS